MNIFIVLLTLILIEIFGFALIEVLGLLKKSDKLSKLGYSFGLGVGFISLQLFIYSRLSIAFSQFNILIPIIGLIIIYLLKIKGIKLIKFKIPKKFNHIELCILLLIVICLIYTGFEAVTRPPVAWDSWSTWLVQSKIYFLDGKINPNLMTILRFDYPLTIPLLGTFIYTILGKVDDFSVLLSSTGFLIFLAITFFAFLNKRYGIRYALVFTLLLVSTQNFIRHGGRLEAGIADLPVGYFALCSATLFLDYLKNKSIKLLFLLLIFLGFTGVIKFEGMLISIVIALFVILEILKGRKRLKLLLLIFWILPFLDWQLFRKINNVNEHYLVGHQLLFSINKTINSITGTLRELINIKSWNLLWIIYFFTFLKFRFLKSKELIFLHSLVLTQLILYVLIYIFTFGNSPQSSIERLLIHIAGIAFLAVAIESYPVVKGKRIKIQSLNILKKLV